jgi:predicted RNA polymerase sigma factor
VQPAAQTQATINALWRIESPKLIARLARMTRDVGLAEELAQDALVTALEKWPESGVPDNPGAWLMATAKNRALDAIRRSKMVERKHEELAPPVSERPQIEDALDDDVGDDMLRLNSKSRHPVH